MSKKYFHFYNSQSDPVQNEQCYKIASAPLCGLTRIKYFNFFIILILFFPYCIASQTFTFLQVTDCHVPHSDSLAFLRSLKSVGSVYLAPYKVTSGMPEFIVCTGDLTEFGGGALPDYLQACKETPLPWYHIAGNHDNTWYSIRPDLRKLHSSPFYAFSFQGCHFIMLDSSTPQDPRPSFGREQIVWLQKELAPLSRFTPIFVFCHHPPGTSEFSSPSDGNRLLDLLRPYNVVAFIVGHGHKPSLSQYNGFPIIMGGQGYGEMAGYNVFDVKDGYLRVAYRKGKDPEATIALFEKKITQQSLIPYIPLTLQPETKITSRAWSVQADGAFKAGPTLYGNHLYAGALDGKIYAFRKDNGQMEWAFSTGGEILGRILVTASNVFATSSDGKVYALDHQGILCWSKDTGVPLYAPAVAQGNNLFVANREGGILCLTNQGEIQWQQKHAEYTIESMPYVTNTELYLGSWDGYLYRYCISDGSLQGKIRGVSSATQSASRYYSPADCSPLVEGNRLFATDRGYILGEWDIETGKLLRQWPKISAISFSQDKKSLYLRQTTGELTKMSLSGENEWIAPNVCDSIPTPATEFQDKVYICSGSGKLSILDKSTGKIVSQYQVSNGIRVYGEIAIEENFLYIADMDGKISSYRK